MDNDARVQSAFADLVLPHRFACLRFDRVDHTVAGALDQQPCAVDVDDDRRRISRVVRTAAGSAYPHRLARLLVEGHEAMRAASVLAPLKCYAAHDYEIAVDDRGDGASAVCRKQSEVFTERTLPQNFSVAIETDQVTADAEYVDVSRRRIADWRGPADSMWRHVAQVDVEAMLPEEFSGVGVKAHDAFLERLAFTGGVLKVNTISHDDRRRAATVWSSPCEVLTAGRPFDREVLFSGDAVAIWSAPFGPIAKGKNRQSKAKIQRNGDQVSHFGGPSLIMDENVSESAKKAVWG